MPVYTFENKVTKEQWTETMSMSERESFLKDHPSVHQLIVSAPSLGCSAKLGLVKPDREFRNMLSYIKKRNPGSTIRD